MRSEQTRYRSSQFEKVQAFVDCFRLAAFDNEFGSGTPKLQ